MMSASQDKVHQQGEKASGQDLTQKHVSCYIITFLPLESLPKP